MQTRSQEEKQVLQVVLRNFLHSNFGTVERAVAARTNSAAARSSRPDTGAAAAHSSSGRMLMMRRNKRPIFAEGKRADTRMSRAAISVVPGVLIQKIGVHYALVTIAVIGGRGCCGARSCKTVGRG